MAKSLKQQWQSCLGLVPGRPQCRHGSGFFFWFGCGRPRPGGLDCVAVVDLTLTMRGDSSGCRSGCGPGRCGKRSGPFQFTEWYHDGKELPARRSIQAGSFPRNISPLPFLTLFLVGTPSARVAVSYRKTGSAIDAANAQHPGKTAAAVICSCSPHDFLSFRTAMNRWRSFRRQGVSGG